MEQYRNLNSVMETINHFRNGIINKTKIISLFICLIAGLIFISCKKTINDDSPIIPDDEFVGDSLADEPLSPEFLEFLESLPVINITIDDFDFENLNLLKSSNNKTMVFCRSEIDKVFFEMGKFALTQTNDFNNNDKIKLTKNKQTKLAYIWGGKKGLDVLDWGTKYGSKCTDKLYGFDCSGFVSKIFQQVGINISTGTAHKQFNEIKNLKHFGSYKGEIIVEELFDNEITGNNLQNGDIIFRINEKDTAKHIGIVLKTIPYGVALFQSIGDKNSCTKNKDSNHGPVLAQLPTLDGFKLGNGKPRVLRIRPKIFEVEPNKLQFNYNADAKSFTIKTSSPVKIEEVKSLDEDICRIESATFVNTCGDTIIHTINVFPKINLSDSERTTQITIKAKIVDKIEEKSIDIIQAGNTNIAVFQLDFVINEKRESIFSGEWINTYKHCNTESILHNLDVRYGRAFIPSFSSQFDDVREKDWNWGINSTGWPNYDPISFISWHNGFSVGYPPMNYHYTYWDELPFVWINIRFEGDITQSSVNEVVMGTIEMGDHDFYNQRVPTCRGTATIKRIK